MNSETNQNNSEFIECKCKCPACFDGDCPDCDVPDCIEPTCRCRESLPGSAMVA